MPKALRLALLACVLVLAGVSGWLAARATLQTPTLPKVSQEQVYIKPSEGKLGRSLSLDVTATWASSEQVLNAATGTLTSLNLPATGIVDNGDTLYTVDLEPVVAMRGVIPAFRDLQMGSEGADVTQLEKALTELHLFSGTADGRFGSATQAAVLKWQKRVGLRPTGVFSKNSVVFFAHLPQRVRLPTDFVPGTILSPGLGQINGLSQLPVLTLTLDQQQVTVVPRGTEVVIQRGDKPDWKANLGPVVPSDDANGTLTFRLLSPAGASSICTTFCGEIPLTGETRMTAKVVVVPEASGLIVPRAAVRIRPDGTSEVVTKDGEAITVTVLASVAGQSVIAGPENLGQESLRLFPTLATP